MGRRSLRIGLVAGLLATAFVGGCPVAAIVSEPNGEVAPTPAPPSEPARDDFVTEPACAHEIGPGGELRVAGQATGMAVALEPPSRVRSYPYTKGAIVLAVGSDTPWWPFFGSDVRSEQTLWLIPCATPSELGPLLTLDGADFAWAAPEPGGGGLLFSFGAVQRLDFAVSDYGPVTKPPLIPSCWMGEPNVEAREYVAGWVAEDRLLIHVGGPCGFEAEWVGGTAILSWPGAERQPSAHVGTVTADSKGRLWVGDGGQCAAQATVWDRGEPGVWRSDDRGASWRFVGVPGLDDHGVDAIWTDGDRLLVRAECCYPGPADGCDGGELLRSDDAGASWRDITPQPGPPAEFEPSVVRVHVGASLDELDVLLDTEPRAALRSRDGGRKWTALPADVDVGESPISRSAKLGEQVFEASIDGVIARSEDGSTQVVLRPSGPPRFWDGG